MCMHSRDDIGSENFRRFRKIVKALHCPTRWLIIECLKDREMSTRELLDCLLEKEKVTMTALYYHLSELKNAGIVEISGYIEEKGGAPQKVWRLRLKKVEIPLVDDDVGDRS